MGFGLDLMRLGPDCDLKMIWWVLDTGLWLWLVKVRDLSSAPALMPGVVTAPGHGHWSPASHLSSSSETHHRHPAPVSVPVVPLLARVGRHDNVTDQDEDVSAVTRLMRSLVPHCGLSPAAATASPTLSHDQDLNGGTNKGLVQCFLG